MLSITISNKGSCAVGAVASGGTFCVIPHSGHLLFLYGGASCVAHHWIFPSMASLVPTSSLWASGSCLIPQPSVLSPTQAYFPVSLSVWTPEGINVSTSV